MTWISLWDSSSYIPVFPSVWEEENIIVLCLGHCLSLYLSPLLQLARSTPLQNASITQSQGRVSGKAKSHHSQMKTIRSMSTSRFPAAMVSGKGQFYIGFRIRIFTMPQTTASLFITDLFKPTTTQISCFQICQLSQLHLTCFCYVQGREPLVDLRISQWCCCSPDQVGAPKSPDLWSHCKDEMINPFEKSVPGPVAVGVIVGQFLTNAKSAIA